MELYLMKGTSRYAPVEKALSRLSSDQMNELYLSGELDRIYEDFDRTGEIKIKRNTKRKKKVRGEK